VGGQLQLASLSYVSSYEIIYQRLKFGSDERCSMKPLELEVARRQITGKKVSSLRRQGIIPGNIYGHGIDSVPVQVDAKALKHLLSHVGRTDLVLLKVNGSKEPVRVLVRDVQRNPITDEPLHVDFFQVRATDKIKAEVPLEFVGEAPVLERVSGTTLLYLMDSLHIEALPDHLPHSLQVDLSVLEDVEQSIHVKDIPVSQGITVLNDPEQVVVKVAEARKEVEEVAAAAEVAAAEEAKEGEEEASEED
jgi:large subunit ribosomal protein L25